MQNDAPGKPVISREATEKINTKLPSYLEYFNADIWRHLLPFFSYPCALKDNRDDAIMHTHAQARKVAQLAFEFCNFDLASDKVVNKNFIRASELYMKAPLNDVHSFFLPNHISLACALNTPGAFQALEEEIDNQMENFRNLSQADKNKLLIDVMRRCPSPIIVKKMIKNGAEVNTHAQESQFTPVRYAVEAGLEDVVKLVLHYKGSADSPDKCAVTPLMRAVILGYTRIVHLLARKAHGINTINNFGLTALYYAAKSGNASMVKTLLKHGARILFSDESQLKNVFVAAVESRSLEVLKLFLEVSEQGVPSIDFQTTFLNAALKRAAELGYEEMVRAILWAADHGANNNRPSISPDFVYEDEKTALTASIENEHISIAELLIDFARLRYFKQLGTYDAARSVALMWSVFKSLELAKVDVVKASKFKHITRLLLHDDAPNPMGNKHSLSACFFAAHYQNERLLDELLACASARTDHPKERALYEGVEVSSTTAVASVLKTFPNMRACNEQRETIFFKAVSTVDSNSIEIINLLLDAGSDPTTKNTSNVTPVHAVMNNPNAAVRLYIISELQKRNVPLDESDIFGDTPLIVASYKEQFMPETAEMLLSFGANPNHANLEGNTALIYAVGRGNEELAEILLYYGADPNKRNNSGCGSLTKAAGMGKKSLVERLVAAGGRLKDFQDSMLRQAAKANDVELMGSLIIRGANLNGESSSLGNTPLHKAVNSIQYEPIKLLLDQGADARYKNRKGETPLELSVGTSDDKIMQLLTEHGN